MTIYNINFGIGWASSGVEYAQSYRAKLLRTRKQTLKFVFLDFIQNENIQTLTHNLGFKDHEVMWIYQYFTDIKIAPTTITVEDITKSLAHEMIKEETLDKVHRIYFKNHQTFVTCYLKEADKPIVDRAEFVSNGMLVRKDFYSYTRVLSEFYAPFDNKAKAYMRQFYNEDGTVAYEEYLNEDSDKNIYMINHTPLYGKRAFVAYFMQQLNLTEEDIVILDRATKIGQSVLEHHGQSKLGVVVHAEHFSQNATDDQTILWNNYYEYQFMNAEDIDFFITATEAQKETLSQQFKHYYNQSPRIKAIPVGALDKLNKTKVARRPYSIVTASRLANEKHVDWLVRAVVKAKETLPELTFDIYGEGGERSKIQSVIDEYNATDYIHLKGHVDLQEIYKNYELFLSASQSEGFGLTLMEAVGSGLGMIGFDVNYGNPTFIKDNVNGYLIPVNLNEMSLDTVITNIADKIIAFYQMDLNKVAKASYKIAEPFKKQHIKQRWLDLFKEVMQ